VDGVQVAKIKNQVGENQTGRLPFGLPGVAGKTKGKAGGEGETISNANSLWIQYFYSNLNATGRAGFVMASSASDAGNKDRDIRQQLVQTGHVDVMISIGPKFFYTRSLPCTLWFYDKGKSDDLLGTVLMIDARNEYTVVSARSHVFTPEQLSNLSAITWLYRGQHERFTELLSKYQQETGQYMALLAERLAVDEVQIGSLSQALQSFGKLTLDAAALATARQKLGDEHGLTDALLADYRAQLHGVEALAVGWRSALDAALASVAVVLPKIQTLNAGSGFELHKTLQTELEAMQPALKAGLAALETRHKAWLKLLDLAEKNIRARQWPAFAGDAARDAKKSLLPRDVKKREKPTVRDAVVEAFKRASYFVAQGHWLLSRFSQGLYENVPGLCKAVSQQEIADNDYSLTPGRYVGVAAVNANGDEGEAFMARMKVIHSELDDLNTQAVELACQVQSEFLEWAQ
jgi:type I restriction enzyme M protein